MTELRRVCRPAVLISFTLTLVFAATHGDAPWSACAVARPTTTTTATMVVPGSPDDVFALFAPGRRSEWDPDWDIEITSPGRGRQDGPGEQFHKADRPETLWTVVGLDADRRMIDLEYVRPDFYDMAVRIVCTETEAGDTSVEVTYTAVAHSEEIHQALDSTLAHQIDSLVGGKDGWRDLLTQFLTTGTRVTPFEPVAIERRHVIELDAPPDRVFAIANPAGGNHWTTSTPAYLFGAADRPSGAMWRESDRWYLVADYDPVDRSMKTVLFIPETEFMIEELRCDPAPGGGTTMTVTWRVAGLPPGGNEAVQAFFDSFWEIRMARLADSYRKQLARAAGSR